jgi:hypothetical protein
MDKPGCVRFQAIKSRSNWSAEMGASDRKLRFPHWSTVIDPSTWFKRAGRKLGSVRLDRKTAGHNEPVNAKKANLAQG